MKIFFRIALYSILSIVAMLLIFGLILAYLPTQSKISNHGISIEQAAFLRKNFSGPHHQFTTTDGETLFLRRWNPDSLAEAKKELAVLIFHGIRHIVVHMRWQENQYQLGMQHLDWITGAMVYRVETGATIRVKIDGMLIAGRLNISTSWLFWGIAWAWLLPFAPRM
jgi:hypothetical protein